MAYLKDVLYPGNVKRREEVVRKYQEVLCCMKDNFRATNQLAGYMKEHFDLKSTVGRIVHTYNKVTLKEGTTIKENCEMFSKEAQKLQMAVAEVRGNK